MLKPLQEFICDSCGQLIESPEQGYVEWRETDNQKKFGFRIVHHAPHSPRRAKGGNCYYSNAERGGDLDLRSFLGVEGLIHMTSFIDDGVWHVSEYSGPDVLDLREWTVFLRRLQVPYFEEAHRYAAQMREERAGGDNQVYLYLPTTLKRVIEEHG